MVSEATTAWPDATSFARFLSALATSAHPVRSPSGLKRLSLQWPTLSSDLQQRIKICSVPSFSNVWPLKIAIRLVRRIVCGIDIVWWHTTEFNIPPTNLPKKELGKVKRCTVNKRYSIERGMLKAIGKPWVMTNWVVLCCLYARKMYQQDNGDNDGVLGNAYRHASGSFPALLAPRRLSPSWSP
ncbi:hypothetical protein OG21DRAFT_1520180 [Imleria badia]|nr:hypothetical protein OG21DRAFT_1520180 [Imleria badia]